MFCRHVTQYLQTDSQNLSPYLPLIPFPLHFNATLCTFTSLSISNAIKEVWTKFHKTVLYLVMPENHDLQRNVLHHFCVRIIKLSTLISRRQKDRSVHNNYWFTKNVHVTAGWIIMWYLFINVLEEKRVYIVTNKNWDLIILKYKGAYFECD
jgi:hypothetical protein